MKKLMNRAGLLVAAFALALAVALALNAARQTPAAAQIPATPTPTPTQLISDDANASAVGYDMDGNGLIEITTHEQLNAMRYDPDGDGKVSDADHSEYARFFIIPPCEEATPCKGYELKSDISLAAYKNTWTPMSAWQAVFDGNGFSVTDLEGQHGLFTDIGVSGDEAINDKTAVRNVDVVGAKITRGDEQRDPVGALAARNYATIIGSYATGEIKRNATENNGALGGLVGHNWGTIAASVADVSIKVTDIPDGIRMRVGGFVGVNYGDIYRSYAYGNVIDARSNDAREATDSGIFHARGFAVNNALRDGHASVVSSLSYGDKIVTGGDLEDAEVDFDQSEYPAEFASGLPEYPDSCALADESQFTCPTPTPTPTPTPSPTPTLTPIPTPTTPTPTLTPTPTRVADPDPAPTAVGGACIQPIEPGVVSGTWDAGCVSANLPSDHIYYAKFYTFTLDARADVAITLSSAESTYLYLLSGAGMDGDIEGEAGDDNTPTTTLTKTLEPGSYTIESTTFGYEIVGDFTLELAITQ